MGFISTLTFPPLAVFLLLKLTCGRTQSAKCLIGKTAIVTGGNTGIGRKICSNLASRGVRLIIADKIISDETRTSLIEQSQNTNIHCHELDLSNLESVRNFSCEILANEPRLDILINNAGIFGSHTAITADNLPTMMQINHFGPFLLTYQLVELLTKSQPSRVLFTGSFMSYYGFLREKNLNLVNGNLKSESSNSPWSFILDIYAYCNSKLAVSCVSDVFAAKLRNTGVLVNCVNPGWTKTPLISNMCLSGSANSSFCNVMVNCAEFLGLAMAKSTWDGSQTSVHVATSQDLNNVSGEYYSDCIKFIKPPQISNKKFKENIWNLSEKLVKITDEERENFNTFCKSSKK